MIGQFRRLGTRFGCAISANPVTLHTHSEFDQNSLSLGCNAVAMSIFGKRADANGVIINLAIGTRGDEVGRCGRFKTPTANNEIGRHHAAALAKVGTSTFLRAASWRMPSMRHFGIEPDVFQLDTVVGARSSAEATATVPPSASMNWSTVCITQLLR